MMGTILMGGVGVVAKKQDGKDGKSWKKFLAPETGAHAAAHGEWA